MYPFTSADLRQLIHPHTDPCVSIYMPIHWRGKEIEQNPIRLKNLLREAENRLSALELRKPDIDKRLQPARTLLSDLRIWQQGSGLALFMAEDVFYQYLLPLTFDELLVINDRFHTKPLLPLLTDDGQYFLLTLSLNKVRLFRGTRYTLDEIPLDVPTSMAEALRYDDPQRQLQQHSAGGGTAVFHGHTDTGTDKKDILRFFYQVNDGVSGILKDEQAPLVLAGVDYLLPIYEEANTYRHVIKGMHGSPENFKLEDLHHQSWGVVEPVLLSARQQAKYHYQEANNKALHNLNDILNAAQMARVDTLMVAKGVRRWGKYHADEQTFELHEERQLNDQDLLDLAAVHTLTNGGQVYIMEPDDMPNQMPAVAVLRY